MVVFQVGLGQSLAIFFGRRLLQRSSLAYLATPTGSYYSDKKLL